MKRVRLILTVAFICIRSLHSHAQAPVNDEPCDAVEVTVNNTCNAVTGTNINATASSIPAPTCGNYNGGDVWFKFTVPANGTAHISTQETSTDEIDLTDMAMELYRGSCTSLTSLNLCDANSSQSSGSMPEINITSGLTPGETIWVRIWEDNNNDIGVFEICITTIQTNNDNPCTAPILNIDNNSGYYVGTNIGATNTAIPNPPCGNYNGDDVWFQTTIGSTGTIHISLLESDNVNDLSMAIYSGNCSALTLISCNDNSGINNMPDITQSGLTIGQPIWIRIWSNGNNDQGTFGILISENNDDPCNAILLTPNTSCSNIVGNNINMSSSSGVPAPGCGSYSGGDVWYKTVVPANGHIYVVTSSGTLTDGAVALYRGSCNSLILIACEYQQGPGVWGEMSFVGLNPGETIWIRVWDENDNDEGSFHICVTSNPITTPPTCNVSTNAGATCASATSICNLDGYCGNTISFSANYWPELDASFRACIGSTNTSSGTIIQNNSFLKFTASANTADFNVWVTSTTKGIGIQMMFFETNSCGSGPVICHGGYDDIRPGPEKLITATGLIPGNTYYLMIDGVSTDQCNYVIKALTPPSPPTAGTLSGTTDICLTNTGNIFSSTLTGGSWTSASPSVATINASNGTITPISSGSAIMTYTIPGIGVCPSATGTRTVVITDPPQTGILSGTQSICSNGTTTFTSTQGGGTWTSSASGIAAINNTSGVITPVAAGTATMTYTVTGTGGCSDATDTRTVTITANPTAGTLSGTQNICLNNNTNIFSSTVAGGTWSSSDNTIASINNSGLITPVSAGTTAMTYTVADASGICPSATQSLNLTITSPPSAGTLSGTQNICINNTTTSFSSTQTGGSWSSSNTSIATINSSTGVITPVTAGNATMTYTVTGTGGCANATDTRTINITAIPSAGTLTGIQNICLNNTANTFSSTVAGGTWSSSDNTIATINNSGLITPVSAGTTTMTYTVADASGFCPSTTQSLVVNITSPPSAGTLSGNQNICINNSSTSFSSTQNGGSWSSSNNSIATINSITGAITPVTAGTATMTYTVTGTGGCANATDVRNVNIVDLPTATIISNNGPVCKNSNAIFTINGTPNATITYQINGGSTRSIILDNTGTGNITLSAVSSTQSLSLFDASLNGCSKSLAGSLSEVQILPFTINLYLSPTSALPGTSIQATVSSTNGSITGTIWQPSTLLTNNNTNQTFIAPGSSTNIIVTATSAQGCTDSKSQFLEIVKNNQVYFIPNAFIPGRGNDPDINTLKLYGPEIKSATLKIFNQWGQCIFVSDNPKQKGWDGKYKGNLQPAGVYVYGIQITFNDGSTISKTGSVDLIR